MAMMSSLASEGGPSSNASWMSLEVGKFGSNPVLNFLLSSEMRDSMMSLSRGSSRLFMQRLGIHSFMTMVGLRPSREAGSLNLSIGPSPCAGGEQYSGAGGEPLRLAFITPCIVLKSALVCQSGIQYFYESDSRKSALGCQSGIFF